MIRTWTWTAGLLVVLAGCSDGGNGEDAGEDTDAEDPSDGIGPPDTAVDPDVGEVPDGSLVNPFTMDIDGAGSVRVASIGMERCAGPIDITGSVASIAYEMTDWSEWGYILFHVVAPEADTLNVMYLYCEEDVLSWVWHEDYELAMDYEAATGSCSHAVDWTVVADPGLAALAARPFSDQLATGFLIDGAQVGYSSTGPGMLVMDGQVHDLYPFEVVDCTVDCTADPADGWWELHSLVVGRDSGRPCFCVLYMLVADTAMVQVGYPLCLEPLEHMPELFLDASWTAEPSGGGGAPSGPRPAGHVLRPLPPSMRSL